MANVQRLCYYAIQDTAEKNVRKTDEKLLPMHALREIKYSELSKETLYCTESNAMQIKERE